MKQLHLISGLPRSGSTLLCQILSMNPDFHATPTSPMLEMLTVQQSVFSHNGGFKALDRLAHYDDFADAQRAFLQQYYAKHDIVFDKNRGWPMHLMKLDEILDNEDTRIIWTYRKPLEVVASMESQHRKHPLIQYTDEQQNPGALGTMDARISHWIADAGILTVPASALHEAVHNGYEDRIKIIEYDSLCKNPQSTLDTIHDFLGIKEYKYDAKDWKNLKQKTIEFDNLYNYKFSHQITEGEIKHSQHDLTHLKAYEEILSKRYEWLDTYCQKEVVKSAGQHKPRSQRMNGKKKNQPVGLPN